MVSKIRSVYFSLLFHLAVSLNIIIAHSLGNAARVAENDNHHYTIFFFLAYLMGRASISSTRLNDGQLVQTLSTIAVFLSFYQLPGLGANISWPTSRYYASFVSQDM